VHSEINGCPLSKEELFMFLLTLLVAGNETTRTLLSGAALVLDQHSAQRAALAHDPSLMPGAVEECLRWVTPVQAFCRTATGDCMVGGVPIGRGDYLCLLYASGNRDEGTFGADAGSFDIRRPANPMHVAFGFGSMCASEPAWPLGGAHLHRRAPGSPPNYAITGPAEHVASTTVAGIRALPVVLAP